VADHLQQRAAGGVLAGEEGACLHLGHAVPVAQHRDRPRVAGQYGAFGGRQGLHGVAHGADVEGDTGDHRHHPVQPGAARRSGRPR
jgi:hypothetical protein